MRAAIIGCGSVGQKRAKGLGAASSLVACADINLDRAARVAASFPECFVTSDWRAVVARRDVDFVVVATPHNFLSVIARRAIECKKHVLVEKPAAHRLDELKSLAAFAKKKGVCVRVGFNHRFHRAFRAARRIVDSGGLGPLMFVRGRYGHGGRVGYDREWRAIADVSGGGELIDQGAHLIDLARWFLGEFRLVEGFAHTYFWDMAVDDNAFLLLRTMNKQTAFLHASCTEWKNTFSFELYGRKGKLQVEGLGGSYGVERLAYYRMLPEMGPPETTIWEYPMADDSWQVEIADFLEDIRLERPSKPGLEDAIAVLEIVENIYKRSGYDHNA